MTQGQCIGIENYPEQVWIFRLIKYFALATIFVTALTFPALAQIQGSAHDFSSHNWSDGEVCAVCHLPHLQGNANGSLPLWNHELSSARYVMYASSTLTQVPQQPSSENVSRLCLSCHDGTVALDSFGGKQGGNYIPGSLSLGTDLSDDHPIGVAPIRQGNSLVPVQGDGVKYYDGKVECPSCHDVHNNQVADERLLRVAREGSQLCFQCHDK